VVWVVGRCIFSSKFQLLVLVEGRFEEKRFHFEGGRMGAR